MALRGVGDDDARRDGPPDPRRGRHLLQALPGLPRGPAGRRRARSSGRSSAARECGALILVHAENGGVIDVLVKQALARGETAPRHHALTRPPATEAEATARAIAMAELAGAPLYVVHLSCAAALEHVTAARDRGQTVFAETCPQYLFLSMADYDRPGLRGGEVRDVAAAAGGGEPGGPLARPRRRRPAGRRHRPLPVHARRQGPRAGRLLEDPERRARHRDADDAPVGRRRARGTDRRAALRGADRRRPGAGSSASGRARARSRWAPTPTSCSGTRSARRASRSRRSTCGWTTAPTRGGSSAAAPPSVMSRGEVIVDRGEWKGRPGRGQFLKRPTARRTRPEPWLHRVEWRPSCAHCSSPTVALSARRPDRPAPAGRRGAPEPGASGRAASWRSRAPTTCARPCSGSARARTTSAPPTAGRTPSGCSRGSASGAGTRRSRPSTCCSRRRRSGCSS